MQTKLCVGCGTYKPLNEFKPSAPGFFSRDGHNHTCIVCNHPKEWVKVDGKLQPYTEQEWPEDRVNIIGQNGNDGLHYEVCKEQA